MNPYPRVIDIIVNPATDFKQIVLFIAKTNPSIIIKAIDSERSLRSIKDSTEIIPIQFNADTFNGIKNGVNKITLIKQHREKTGVSLLQAKNDIEAMIAYYTSITAQNNVQSNL